MIKRNLLKRKIVKITTQRRNSSRRTLYFDDQSVFGISEDVFVSSEFSVGDTLDEDDYQNLLQSESQSKVMDAAFHLLQYRMRSTSELQGRLRQKGFEISEIEPVIQKLLKMEYLNDEAFAIAFCRDKVRSKRIGHKALRQELIVHRLDSSLVDRVMDDIYIEFPITELIRYHLDKKKIQAQTKLDQKEKKRLLSFLQRKGFSWSDIADTLNTLEIT